MMRDKSILIVDDAAFMRMMLKRAILGAGEYQITEAENGERALEVFRESKPDLVLLDISMPGMSGINVLKEIKKIDPASHVVMCSAVGQEMIIREAIEAGALDFIVKPFKPEQIVQVLAHVFS